MNKNMNTYNMHTVSNHKTRSNVFLNSFQNIQYVNQYPHLVKMMNNQWNKSSVNDGLNLLLVAGRDI